MGEFTNHADEDQPRPALAAASRVWPPDCRLYPAWLCLDDGAACRERCQWASDGEAADLAAGVP